MLKYFFVDSIKFPTYGMVVLLGIVIVNVIAGIVIRRNKLDFYQYVLIELAGGIGAIYKQTIVRDDVYICTCALGHTRLEVTVTHYQKS